jgi:hypothetical protein
MKAILFKTVKTGKEDYFYQMVKFLREPSKTIWFGDKEYL